MSGIPGYDFGDESVPDAPISMAEFERLKDTVMWSAEDDEYLRMAGETLEPQVDDMLDRWLGFLSTFEFMNDYRRDADTGELIEEYGERSRPRYGQWIRDTCDTPYDEDWLDYQFEIGRRTTASKRTRRTARTPHYTSTSATSRRPSTSTQRRSESSWRTPTTPRRILTECIRRGSSPWCFR
jgi:hypothetical protein